MTTTTRNTMRLSHLTHTLLDTLGAAGAGAKRVAATWGGRGLGKSALVMAGLVALSSSLTGCFIYQDDVVVYDPGPPVVVSGPGPSYAPAPIYVGDLAMTYDFGGWSCWELGMAEVEFEVYDSAGWLVAEDWGMSCKDGATILLRDLPLDQYYVSIVARDGWGTPAYAFDGYVQHDRSYSSVWLTLY